MKKKENEVVAPRGSALKTVASIACFMTFALAVTVGYQTAPEPVAVPTLTTEEAVLTQPCEAIAEEAVEVIIEPKPAEKPESIQTKEVVEIQETVAYKTIEKETTELKAGQKLVKQKGCPGLKKITKEVIKDDGRVIEESVISQETIAESTPEIMLVGIASCVQPLETMRVTSPYGERWGRMHEGVDLGMPEGSPVLAVKEGIVTFAEYTEGYGNLVKIDHGEGLETYYAHCSRLDVGAGQQVEAGQQIALVGSTGNSTGPHLHFEVRVGGVTQDPVVWLESGV